MDLRIALEESTGNLTVIFKNDGNQTLELREIYEPRDVIVESETGVRAEFWLSIFSTSIETFILKPGQSHQSQINLASDFIYPAEGNYSVWLEYNTANSAGFYKLKPLDSVCLQSNKIVFPITIPKS